MSDYRIDERRIFKHRIIELQNVNQSIELAEVKKIARRISQRLLTIIKGKLIHVKSKNNRVIEGEVVVL
jgi:hypothetical protein